MRKLLLVLCTTCFISFSFANQIDNGTYQGYLQQDGGYPEDSATGTSSNDTANISIPKLSALGATGGILTGTLNGNVNTNPNANCIDNANFSAIKLGIQITASKITLTNCSYKNHVLSGNYDAVVFGLIHNTGVFNFTFKE